MKDSIKPEEEKISKLKLGKLNFDTPLNLFLKEVCKENLDSIIIHKNVDIIVDNEPQKKCSLILLKIGVVKSDIIDSKDFIKDKAKLDSVLLLEMKRVFDIDFEIKETFYYLKIIYITISGPSALNLHALNVKFENINDGKIFKFFLSKQKNLIWQKFFENTIPIPPPFIYQFHFFLQKLNSRGVEDNRIIVLTNKYLSNFDYDITLTKKNETQMQEYEYKLQKIKWALYIGAFEELTLIGKNKKKKTNYLTIKIKINKQINKTFINNNKLPYKNKTSIEFVFHFEKVCRFFIYQIRRIHSDCGENKILKVTENL